MPLWSLVLLALVQSAHLQYTMAQDPASILNNITHNSIFDHSQMEMFARGLIERGVTDRLKKFKDKMTGQKNSKQPNPGPPHPEPPQVLSVPLEDEHSVFTVPITIAGVTYNVIIDINSRATWTTHKPEHLTSGRLLTDISSPAIFTVYSPFKADDYRVHISIRAIEKIVEGTAQVSFANPELDSSGKPYNGGLGLALTIPGSTSTRSAFVDFLREVGIKPIFALSLGHPGSGSRLHLGGPHPHYHVNLIKYYNVMPQTGSTRRWQIKDVSIRVNDHLVELEGKDTAFLSSTRLIYGPAPDVKKIYDKLREYQHPVESRGLPGESSGHRAESSEHESEQEQPWEYDTFPCGHAHKITFKWVGHEEEWGLSPEQFNLGPVGGRAGRCRGVIKAHPIPALRRVPWLVGHVFLEGYYSVYDGESEPPRFGLVEKPPPPSYDPPPSYTPR